MRRAIVITLAVLASAVPAATSFAADDAALPPALNSLQTCLQTSHRLLVLDLIDESRSLRAHDKDNARVAGVLAQLGGLARLSNGSAAKRGLQVEVRLAQFARGYRELGPVSRTGWSVVNQATLGELKARAKRVAQNNDEFNTDFVVALKHAQDDLLERSSQLTADGSSPPCMAIVWFTDGGYDLRPPKGAGAPKEPLKVPYSPAPVTTDQVAADAERAGNRQMCDQGGILDQIRANEIRLLAVHLNRNSDARATTFLQQASEPAAHAGCGQRRDPDAGLYLSAADSERLLYLFGSLFDVPAAVEYCPEPGRTDCRFTTVAGLSSFTIQVTTPQSAHGIALRAPDASRVVFQNRGPFSTTIAGAKVTAQWFSPQQAEIDALLTHDSTDWVGRWAMSFVDQSGTTGGRGTYTLRLRADLFPAAATRVHATVGKPATAQLEFVDAAGRPVHESPLLDGATMTATLVDLGHGDRSPLTVTPAGPGRWSTTFTPTARDASEVPRLALDLTATLAPTAGVTVHTAPRRVPLIVVPPESFPSVAPSALNLKSVRGRHGRTSGTVTVSGPAHGSGCVRISGDSIDLPQRRDAAALLLPGMPTPCLPIKAGDKKRLKIVAETRVEASGRARGTLTFFLRGTDGKELRTLVPVAFDMRPPPNTARAWERFIGFLLVGVGLPIAFLLLINWRSARFSPPQLLRYVARDVELTELGLTGAGTAGMDISAAEFELVANEPKVAPKRSFSLDSERFEFATRALGRRGELRPSIFRGPYGVVSAESGRTLAGAQGGSLRQFPTVGTHEAPLSLAGTWVFEPTDEARDADSLIEADEAPERLSGRLLLIIPADATDNATALLVDAERQLRDRYPSLAADSPATRTQPPTLRDRIWRRFGSGQNESDASGSPEQDDTNLFNTR